MEGMTAQTHVRKPAGTSTGGQFASKVHAEPAELHVEPDDPQITSLSPETARIYLGVYEGVSTADLRSLNVRDSDIEQAQQCLPDDATSEQFWAQIKQVAGSRRGPMCASHGGRWGYDKTCDECTDVNGNPASLPNQIDPQYWRDRAAECRQRSADSFARSDTDGYLSQWASDSTAQRHDLQARITDNGGMWPTRTLYKTDSTTPLPARLVKGQFGYSWVYDDDNGSAVWVNPSQASTAAKRDAAMGKKGYREGFVWAPAYAYLSGGAGGATSVRAVVRRDKSVPLDQCEFAGWDTDDNDLFD